ncbi:PIN-like domain-containing protein, partial [Priestia megaterium]
HELRSTIETHTSKIGEAAKDFRNTITDEIENNKTLLLNDPIQKFVDALEERDRIGDPLSSSKLLQIYEEGERRYAYKLPPGYEDIEKNTTDDTRTKQFGDLIIWKCILEKAKLMDTPLIFVTEDVKEDWWHLTEEGEIFEPRRELIAEFNEYTETENCLLMLPMSEFIRHISVINMLSSLHATVEYNAEDISKDIFINHEDSVRSTMESQFQHDGQLDSSLEGGTLNSIDINELSFLSIDISSVDFDDSKASIEGTMDLEVSAEVEEMFSKNYSRDKTLHINVNCDFVIELELDFENDDYSVDDFEVRNSEVLDTTVIHSNFDPIDLCDVCNSKEGDYILNNVGMICDDCASKSDFFICTNCGVVHCAEDYDGDGERCQLCS